MNEESLFAAALDKHDATERQAFLDEACAGNAPLRQRVDKLLAAEQARGILDRTLNAPPDFETYRPVSSLSNKQVFAGRFTLREKLGEGGMGEVWSADQMEPVQRRVALKVIRVGLNSSRALTRFEQERQALALMNHPNIAKVFEAGVENGRPFFVMEFIEGLPLTRHCDEAKLTIPERLQLFLSVCQAVQHAHQKGIIHRDLKPSNILVELHDGRPVPRVIDFGLAKAVGPQLIAHNVSTEIGTLVGTPEYMSPEQADLNNLDIDTRSDIYALGVVLYELLTGSVPLSRQELRSFTFAEMLRVIKEVEPPRPSSKLSSNLQTLTGVAAVRQTESRRLLALVRGELDWIVMKCLEKDPARRYETANELAADVGRYLADDPVLAGPPSAGYRLRKFLRRNRVPALVAALVLLVLVGGVIGTSIGLGQAVQARKAEAARAEGERLAKETAEKRLSQIEKGIDILGAIFEDLDPHAEEKEGRPLRTILGERLDQSAAALEGEAVGDRLVVARLQDRLGRTYLGLGQTAKAQALITRAVAIRQAELGANDPLTLVSMRNQARAYQYAGKPLQAIALLEQVRDAFVEQLGADHPDTLATLKTLASCYQEVGKLPQTIALLEQVRDAEMKNLEPGHPSTLTTLHSLGWAYHGAGQLPRAIALLEQVWDARAKKLGPGHTDTLATLSTLALAYRGVGNLSRSIDLFERAHNLQEKKLGPDHVRTLVTLSDLAGAYQHAGKLPRAIELLEKVHDAQVRKHGTDHRYSLVTLSNLATAYQRAGKLPQAIERFEKVRAAMAKQFGPDHPETLTTLNNLGAAYYAASKWEQALPLFREAAEGIEKQKFLHPYSVSILLNVSSCHEKLQQYAEAETWLQKWRALAKERDGTDSLAYASALATLGKNQLDQKKWTDAESILRECLTIRQKKEPDDWRTFNTQSLLGGALLGQQKYAEAEPLLVQSYRGLRKKTAKNLVHQPQGSPARQRIEEALQRLVQLYDGWNKSEEATQWRKELQALRAPTRKPTSP
jgi:serine/threonine protein kinase/Tfp pilus assembly protein PilF